jgi:hypothetical protein
MLAGSGRIGALLNRVGEEMQMAGGGLIASILIVLVLVLFFREA